MRRPSWVKRSGPYHCLSYPSGYILVKPSWEQYGRVWEFNEGGGPGFPGRMALAARLETFLNAPYTEDQRTEAKKRIELHDHNLEQADIEMQNNIYNLEREVKRGQEEIKRLLRLLVDAPINEEPEPKRT